MIPLHSMMHDHKNHPLMYKMHRIHHTSYANIRVVNSGYFDVLDAFLENLFGPFLMMGLKYLLFGDFRVSLPSFLFLIIFDNNAHSFCNPYSLSFYLPPLDYFLKTTLSNDAQSASQPQYWALCEHSVAPLAAWERLRRS